MAIELFGEADVARLRRAGRIAAETLAAIGARLRAGIATAEIDRWVREDTNHRGGAPSQLGYKGFPAAVCTSRNEVVCHGMPSKTDILRDGDIVNVDVTTMVDGFHGDTSATFVIRRHVGRALGEPQRKRWMALLWSGGACANARRCTSSIFSPRTGASVATPAGALTPASLTGGSREPRRAKLCHGRAARSCASADKTRRIA